MLLRALGLQALGALVATLPSAVARQTTLAILVLVNLGPLVALVTGSWLAGDVLIAYWLETFVVGLLTLLRILTARGSGRRGQPAPVADRVATGVAFCVSYGVATFWLGFMTIGIGVDLGTRGGVRGFLLLLAGMLVSHGVAVAVWWFWRDGRDLRSPTRTLFEPFGRLVLLFGALVCFVLLAPFVFGDDPSAGPVHPGLALVPAVLLVLAKTTADVGWYLLAPWVRANVRVVPLRQPA